VAPSKSNLEREKSTENTISSVKTVVVRLYTTIKGSIKELNFIKIMGVRGIGIRNISVVL
jgi:hypothetical protein